MEFMGYKRFLLTSWFIAVAACSWLPAEEKEMPSSVIEVEASESTPLPSPYVLQAEAGVVDVYVIPIEGPISQPNLFILRRALKEAIANDVEMVILDMDTPGGRVDICLEMMEMLDRFEGLTATYVNVDAISAGSFIAAATKEIYFAPRGTIGASAVIQGTGEDVPETARLKIESYLRAKIRVISKEDVLRGQVIRAMLDKDYELKVGEVVIKPADELLTLTANEAVAEYGDPPRPLLGSGIFESIDDLLDSRIGEQSYEIKDFKVTYSEMIAKWMDGFAPALMGIGLLLLFVEFKTPGFGIFGIAGIGVIVLFFISQYVAGMAGNEAIVFFLLGVVLVLAELLFFPGVLFLAVPGIALMLGSLLWAMVDFWPAGTGSISGEMFIEPTVNLIYGLSIALLGAIVLARLLKGSAVEGALVLSSAVGDSEGAGVEPNKEVAAGDEFPAVGATGVAITPLHPAGLVEMGERRYEARCEVGIIDRGASVRVVGREDFNLLVEAAE
jgi:membrane-bound serine protease (ClpP class)